MDERIKHEQMGDADFYQTGSTQPPKSHNGTIAAFLAWVIFFSGVFNLLDMMNITPFQPPKAAAEESLSLTASPEDADPQQIQTPGAAAQAVAELGILGEKVDEVYQNFYQLPAGVLVLQVEEDGRGQAMGLQVGDIVQKVNGQAVEAPEEISQTLEAAPRGKRLEVEFSRRNRQHKANLILEEG